MSASDKTPALRSAALLAAGLLLLSGPARAEALLDARDPEALRLILAETAEVTEAGRDGAGDPMLTAFVGGFPTVVYFFGCSEGRDCAIVSFNATLDLDAPPAPNTITAWNRDEYVGPALLTEEGDPSLRFAVVLEGGASPDAFRDAFALWLEALGRFRALYGF